jgi:hypothetical protein
MKLGPYLAALALAAVATAPARALQVAGIDYPAQARVGGQTLQLNGAGVRYKFVVKVYTAGLYLAERTEAPEQVISAPGPKRLHVVMSRDIDANELGRLFTRGMQDNVPRALFAKSIAGTLRMAEIFSRRRSLKAGDSFSVDWLPGVGTQILVNGEPEGAAITEPEFFAALISIWLGPRPAYQPLKDELLGRRPPARETSPAN